MNIKHYGEKSGLKKVLGVNSSFGLCSVRSTHEHAYTTVFALLCIFHYNVYLINNYKFEMETKTTRQIKSLLAMLALSIQSNAKTTVYILWM